MDQVTVTIEADELKPSCWKVVFRDHEGKLIGIPLRGVDRGTADEHSQSLGFAFEYGAKHATEVVNRQVTRLWWKVVSKSK